VISTVTLIATGGRWRGTRPAWPAPGRAFRGLGSALFDVGRAGLVERAADQFDRLVDVEGLGQVFEGATLEGGDRRIQVRESGDDDDRDAGVLALMVCSSSRPEAPGMRMSDTSTCGVPFCRAAIASRALEKLCVARFSRARAFRAPSGSICRRQQSRLAS
jgi:hypothetical protein